MGKGTSNDIFINRPRGPFSSVPEQAAIKIEGERQGANTENPKESANHSSNSVEKESAKNGESK